MSQIIIFVRSRLLGLLLSSWALSSIFAKYLPSLERPLDYLMLAFLLIYLADLLYTYIEWIQARLFIRRVAKEGFGVKSIQQAIIKTQSNATLSAKKKESVIAQMKRAIETLETKSL